ncbi:hypothetical protein CLAFUW4_05755 [Fulvia fulva]|uniref:Uncharacterized protein n=1 Tax=Passalora fulva TaxID=5499 RepID=A0A9Q8LIE0_PASFU|nr:uncharacterized protein CLAFUR5_05898 [Fulvia fulva]KAK4624282.1 hypothetical protein CLAFUR4_05749 [Fulvia fulva]KAK4625616.1 hypothetical protein CLAFUR0_05760 [Fulvia fulva]UJO18052.1 hypothetical protein CLAFUR5_05898 [Fulvia fulva]WPV15528.1 hypothetical protein CLAFUW4_05755 [Fulvia fulva]WPV30523.1 hypothetical protein CLAFUW7_05753 [Fulvia fulva]
MLRENLYYNYQYYRDQATDDMAPEWLMNSHTNHCVDALRERLLCTADIGLVPFFWPNASGNAMPDFGRDHKCHSHESVISWSQQHSASTEQLRNADHSQRDSVLPAARDFVK